MTQEEVTVRQAQSEDMDGIMDVENDWPKCERAPREKMEIRLQKFPEGFVVAESGGRLVGTLTCFPCDYDPDNPGRYKTWEEITHNGFFPPEDIMDTPKRNGLYISSGVVRAAARGQGVFEKMIPKVVEVAISQGRQYVFAGAVLPGYDAYCKKHGEIDAREYVFLKKGSRFVDPFMDTYRRLGFAVPNPDHVKEDYFGDAASRNYAAFVVCDVTK